MGKMAMGNMLDIYSSDRRLRLESRKAFSLSVRKLKEVVATPKQVQLRKVVHISNIVRTADWRRKLMKNFNVQNDREAGREAHPNAASVSGEARTRRRDTRVEKKRVCIPTDRRCVRGSKKRSDGAQVEEIIEETASVNIVKPDSTTDDDHPDDRPSSSSIQEESASVNIIKPDSTTKSYHSDDRPSSRRSIQKRKVSSSTGKKILKVRWKKADSTTNVDMPGNSCDGV